MPPASVPAITVDAAGKTDEAVLHEVVCQVYDIAADDRRFRETATADEAKRAGHFDRLRKDYPERREFPYTTVTVKQGGAGLRKKLAGLGFVVV